MKVVIADDDATSRIVLEAIATKLGHECSVAADGSAAWDLLASTNAEVLLTDWLMPGVDGPELCRRVRFELKDRYVYVVLVTALGNQEQVLAGMGAGADDYLVKPVDPFSVRTRLVAAERVTSLHRRLVEVQGDLERATADATERSLTDVLTGLSNRRRMDEDLADTHATAQRQFRGYAVALFDIDHFKAYNDNYGHPEGDEVLRVVARCLSTVVRSGERVYRYGGEEFLLLLDDCDVPGATAVAERLRNAIADLELPHRHRPDEPPIVTLSGGVASWDAVASESVAQVLDRADAALFEAKSRGRNQIGSSANHAAAR